MPFFTSPSQHQVVAVEPVLRPGAGRGDEGLQGVERRLAALLPRGAAAGRGHRRVLRAGEARGRVRLRRQGGGARPRLLPGGRDRRRCPLRRRGTLGRQRDDGHRRRDFVLNVVVISSSDENRLGLSLGCKVDAVALTNQA
ncbi:hypothetical protein AVEN_201492-1 [Araneus ventricosus]|uniref:Uncharacterized protein n=1 Tax=Araneus ventricosus TaxID=182803 RepID=A0A4Y2UK71_ARAVE|nr:hypothetical protein AVEN_135711-1 [Araneus ventricosus]GBO12398.1 hypothetical protein AVEN_6891-1 [Araneus ventricosus]GBO12493.1 hypothetical protein AVEN_79670-1 [Araneus ventricosus]GBO12501.1 hypothetical protein AVEN_201492-1 [Araneus ventricosus]